MAETTEISWCDHTFNPWIGCTKVSPACDHCYAEHLMDHRHHRVEWGGPRSRTSPANWKLPLRWNATAKAAGVRRRVFCASLADVFDNQVPESWRADLWVLIAACDQLDWLLLTKRPQNIAKMLPISEGYAKPWRDKWPWPHVWLGTTAEDQLRYEQRMPHLTAVDCARRFVSYEPALGPVDFLSGASPGDDEPWAAKLDLIICGGESGANARPMHPAWARSTRDQCVTAGIYFHFKQWGVWAPSSAEEWAADDGSHRHMLVAPDGRYGDSVADLLTKPRDTAWMRRLDKKAAGRLLDGRTWDEMPNG